LLPLLNLFVPVIHCVFNFYSNCYIYVVVKVYETRQPLWYRAETTPSGFPRSSWTRTDGIKSADFELADHKIIELLWIVISTVYIICTHVCVYTISDFISFNSINKMQHLIYLFICKSKTMLQDIVYIRFTNP